MRPSIITCCVLPLLLLAVAPAQEIVRRGPWQKRHVPEGWVLHETRNYQIQSQCPQEKAERLGQHMESMLLVYKAMFRPDKEFKKYTIKLFKDHESFLAYGRAPGAAAYYSSTDREMVCYDTGRWMDEVVGPDTGEAAVEPPAEGEGDGDGAKEGEDEDQAAFRRHMRDYEMDILGAAAHEGWHQYFHWYVTSWVQLPSWINEGMGDYFYAALPRKVKGKKIPAELGRMNHMRMLVMKIAAKQGRHVPIDRFIHYTQSEYYSNPSICYAQGWALCQFLLHSGNKDYARVVPTFIRTVRDSSLIDAVSEKAFKGIDLAVLEKEFLEWVKAQKL
ncbi:MAG: DUF1570 domain-containing protein [Planctomycetes bacterium]|nr:DUF1570 domain-containing protein [Planctomycetota bacterium]